LALWSSLWIKAKYAKTLERKTKACDAAAVDPDGLVSFYKWITCPAGSSNPSRWPVRRPGKDPASRKTLSLNFLIRASQRITIRAPAANAMRR
jgi:hypothetical protein